MLAGPRHHLACQMEGYVNVSFATHHHHRASYRHAILLPCKAWSKERSLNLWSTTYHSTYSLAYVVDQRQIWLSSPPYHLPCSSNFPMIVFITSLNLVMIHLPSHQAYDAQVETLFLVQPPNPSSQPPTNKTLACIRSKSAEPSLTEGSKMRIIAQKIYRPNIATELHANATFSWRFKGMAKMMIISVEMFSIQFLKVFYIYFLFFSFHFGVHFR